MNVPAVDEAVSERAASLLEELCAISSASGDATGLRAMADRLAAALAGDGFVAEIVERDGADGRGQPVLIARTPSAGSAHTLLIGHLDTVLPALAPRRANDRLLGTGALDMKGGFAALVGALEQLRRNGTQVPSDLVLVAVPDEEIGGPISERTVHDWGCGARSVLVLEPGDSRGDGETLVTGRRGLTLWRLDARGRAAHSGISYWQGRSALAAAATWCGAVQRMSEEGHGPLVNVGRIVGGDSEFVQDLGEEHRFIGTSQRLNIVADRCIAEGEVRFLSVGDGERTLERMRGLARDIAAHHEVSFELVEVDHIPPMTPTGSGRRIAERLVERAAAAGWNLELEDDRGGVSFPNFLPDPAAVPILDGLGPVGGGMHTRDEYVSLESLRRRIALIAEAILLVAG